MIGGNMTLILILVSASSFIGAPRHHPFYFGIDNMAYVGFGHGNNVNGQLNIFNDFYVE